MPLKTLDDWLAHLERLHPRVIEMGLERTHALKRALNLAPTFPIIVVGGTNGKGSTCAMLEAMLAEAGYRVGCYTSPHLLRYNERVRVNRREASDDELCESFAEVDRARGLLTPTFFEFGTLAAMTHFRRAKVDVAILEVGLGGRLDAVNAFDADCSIVTSIGIDHVEYLGETREAIGSEKAGIFRRGRPAICTDPSPPQSMRAHAEAVGAEWVQLGRDFDILPGHLNWRFLSAGVDPLVLPYPGLKGTFQLNNASAAIAALRQLQHRLPVSSHAIRRGLTNAQVTGRFQLLRQFPSVFIDVAHNPQAAAALATNLADSHTHQRTIAVFAMLGDKDICGVIHAVKHHIDDWRVADLRVPRGTTAAHLANALRSCGVNGSVSEFDSPALACRQALASANPLSDRIVVFGSFHTVADALKEMPSPIEFVADLASDGRRSEELAIDHGSRLSEAMHSLDSPTWISNVPVEQAPALRFVPRA